MDIFVMYDDFDKKTKTPTDVDSVYSSNREEYKQNIFQMGSIGFPGFAERFGDRENPLEPEEAVKTKEMDDYISTNGGRDGQMMVQIARINSLLRLKKELEMLDRSTKKLPRSPDYF